MSEILPGSRGAWVMAVRPRTLPVSVGPVLVGTAVAFAYDQFSLCLLYTSDAADE